MWLSAILEEPKFRDERSPVTIHNYTYALRRMAAFGIVRLEDVSVETARGFLEARMARVKPQSAAADFAALLAVLAHLEETGRCPAKLLAAVRRLAPRQKRRRQFLADFLTADQFAALVAAAPNPRTALALKLAVYTGLRAGELLRLEWRDVDLARRALIVRNGKTGGRRVSLCEPAIATLVAAPRVGPRVVPADRRSLGGWVKQAGERVGLRATLVLCRHTRAAWWVAAGVPLAVVAQQLGHSIEVCARFYAGLSDSYSPVVELGAAGLPRVALPGAAG